MVGKAPDRVSIAVILLSCLAVALFGSVFASLSEESSVSGYFWNSLAWLIGSLLYLGAIVLFFFSMALGIFLYLWFEGRVGQMLAKCIATVLVLAFMGTVYHLATELTQEIPEVGYRIKRLRLRGGD